MVSERSERIHRFIEFFLVGLLIGLLEDLLAIKLSTGESITPSTILIVFAVTFPFAVFSELIVDREQFDFGPIERWVKKRFGK